MSLQSELEDLCGAFDGTAGVAAVNLTTGQRAEVNADLSFPTASMIKILVLFELVRQSSKGTAPMDERIELVSEHRTRGSGLLMNFDAGANLTLRDLAVMMMAISDNTATNMLIDRLGIAAINAAIREAGMTRTELRYAIDFELIAQSNDNLAVSTPGDMADFLGRLRQGHVMPANQVDEMLAIMRIQKYIEPIRRLLPFNPYGDEFDEPQDVWVASKTGSLKGARCEGGLVHTPRAEWTLCVMSRDCPDTCWTGDNAGIRLINTASRAVYDAWS